MSMKFGNVAKINYIFFQDAAAERAKKIFGELDVNGDGELTRCAKTNT